MALTVSSGNNGRSSRGPSPLPPAVSTPANATTRYAAAVRRIAGRSHAVPVASLAVRLKPDATEASVPWRPASAGPSSAPAGSGNSANTRNGLTRCRPASHLGAVTSSHTSAAAKARMTVSHSSRPSDDRQRSLMRSATARPAAIAATIQSAPYPRSRSSHHGLVPLAQRERLQRGDVGIRRVGDVHRRLDEVDGVAKVRRHRALKPPHLHRRREGERDQQRRPRRRPGRARPACSTRARRARPA